MRRSIKVKLFLILTSIILLFVIITQLFSIFFLEDFYLSSKKKTLSESLDRVQQILIKSDQYEDSLVALQDNKNINIVIFDKEYNLIFRTALFNRNIKGPFPGTNMPPNHGDLLKSIIDNITDHPVIKTRIDPRMESKFLSLYSLIKLGDGTEGYIVISTSIDAMKDSVKAASDFILYVSIFVAMIGTIIIFYVSRSISKPIVKMGKVTSEMIKLDFTQRIEVNSHDEIGDLANNINFLSIKLDKTLKELAIANDQLKEDIRIKEKIDQSRKEFIANVSHELKTPISLIGGYAEGLKLNVNKADKDFYCDVIIDESQKMNKLVLSLLDLSQVEAGYKQMKKQSFDIEELVDSILEKYKLMIEEKGLELTVSNHGNCTVMADPERIEQVLTNYLTNALNHVNLNGKITVKTHVKTEQVRVSVFNTGNPIDADQLGRIWESFYKIDQARTREYGGSGLGLSIVKVIIEAHGGKYGAINHDDGVEFWFTLENS